MLKRKHVRALVLDRGVSPGASWHARYEGLRLNSVGWISRLPGLRGGWGLRHYPTREEWIAYLERYVRHHQLEIRFGAEIARIESDGEGWRVELADETIPARCVVVATGYDGSSSGT
jgi:cation diffusion facilitator CzcD-associated flavoprotein CzcO